MRTTIYLPEQLLQKAKKAAAETRRTLTAVIQDALRESLGRRKKKTRGKKVKLERFGATGLQPGVDLDDTASLLDLMEPSRDSRRR